MKNQKAFSLIELLATLVVAGILATVALPNLRNLVIQHKIMTKTNELVKAINLARLESISHPSVPALIIPNPDWSSGCRMGKDNNFDQQLDDKEVIKIFNFGNDQINITPTALPADFKVEYISGGRIRLPMTNFIEFTICNQDPNQSPSGNKVTIFATGRVSSETISCL